MTVELEIVGESLRPEPKFGRISAPILVYLGVLVVLMGFGVPYVGLIDIPVSFFLKNRLHLSANGVAVFRLIAALPLYVSFVFGFIRDTWNPFGLRDRGYLMIFGALCAAVYGFFAFQALGYETLLIAMILATITYLFTAAAQNGLIGVIGRQNLMSGQISAAWNTFIYVPTLFSYWFGGVLSDHLEGQHAQQAVHTLFLVGAVIMAAVALFGLLKPRAVFDHIQPERTTSDHPWRDFKRLLRHRPIYPALMIWLMWNFAPGLQTPLQYYLQNQLHAPDAVFGEWFAIVAVTMIPTTMLFGFLCRRLPLKNLLFWGALVAVPEMVPLLFIHSPGEALFWAAPVGLMSGVCNTAYTDLLIRSCPRGLQGTILMASVALYTVSSRFGDVLGAKLYEHFGDFSVCVIANTVVYALILPMILLVPKHLIAMPDGQAPEGGFD